MRNILLFLLMISGTPVLAARVVVIDGDTLDLDGVRYRIEGIDAPEIRQRCNAVSGVWACGQAARKVLASMVKGKTVHCLPIKPDKYGRMIGHCFADGENLGQQMVRTGHAWAFRKYSDTYTLDEIQAKRQELGIWQAATDPAWDYRASKWRVASQTAPDGCVIKGNISENGKIFHTPWSRWYSKTQVNPSRGERWFCSEAEAVAAGWRAPR